MKNLKKVARLRAMGALIDWNDLTPVALNVCKTWDKIIKPGVRRALLVGHAGPFLSDLTMGNGVNLWLVLDQRTTILLLNWRTTTELARTNSGPTSAWVCWSGRIEHLKWRRFSRRCANRYISQQGITVYSKKAIENVKTTSWPSQTEENATVVEAPGGYKFYIVGEDAEGGTEVLCSHWVIQRKRVTFSKLAPAFLLQIQCGQCPCPAQI